MTVRLTIRRRAWETHVREFADGIVGLVPVVKGNGYGFGRHVLHPIAATLADRVAVGTVHELDHIPAGVTPIVLTPTLTAPRTAPPAGSASARAILTVGSLAHVDALMHWTGAVVVKLRSSMGRYGVSPAQLGELVDRIADRGLRIDGAAIHLPLAGTDLDRRREIDDWLAIVPPAWSVSISHLQTAAYAALRAAHPHRRFELRAGTGLWHGDKSFHAETTTGTTTDTTAGYHATMVPFDGTLVMIGAGSANGVAPLADGRSPFHFAQERITLLEPPHMHTSIGIVARGRACPAPGDRVDVQQPLITTQCDELQWLP